mmetsp:Transcript_15159/g.36062  ORF Transcript_15159/g.36062 Transcript_15159/m.36062 type:complete len:253 (-) Transcript_15159:955-1713(-)
MGVMRYQRGMSCYTVYACSCPFRQPCRSIFLGRNTGTDRCFRCAPRQLQSCAKKTYLPTLGVSSPDHNKLHDHLGHHHQHDGARHDMHRIRRIDSCCQRLPDRDAAHHADPVQSSDLAIDRRLARELAEKPSKQPGDPDAAQYGACPDRRDGPRDEDDRGDSTAHRQDLSPEDDHRRAREHLEEGSAAEAADGEREPERRCHQVGLPLARVNLPGMAEARHVRGEEATRRHLRADGAIEGEHCEHGTGPSPP